MLAFAMMAAIRRRANPPPSKKRSAEPWQKPTHRHVVIDPWSIQEVRRIAIRLARKRIQPAHIIAWVTLA